MQKAGAHQLAAELGLIIVAPDTSARRACRTTRTRPGDFGLGAGFYVNATREPWARHYRMHDYVVQELPALIETNFPVSGRREVFPGHSMGGHGALICALKNPGRYQSVSAFSPISNPLNCPLGREGVFPLPGRRPLALARVGRLRAAGRGGREAADPGGRATAMTSSTSSSSPRPCRPRPRPPSIR